jgi:hypothetical protein
MADQDSASPIDFSDTIVAVATAPGRGALAIVRSLWTSSTCDRARYARSLADEPRRVVVSPVRDAVGVNWTRRRNPLRRAGLITR